MKMMKKKMKRCRIKVRKREMRVSAIFDVIISK